MYAIRSYYAADAVPRMPLHLAKKKYATGSSFFKSLANGFLQGEAPDVNDLLSHIFEPALSNQVSSGNQMIEKLVSKAYVITSYSIHYTKLYDNPAYQPTHKLC